MEFIIYTFNTEQGIWLRTQTPYIDNYNLQYTINAPYSVSNDTLIITFPELEWWKLGLELLSILVESDHIYTPIKVLTIWCSHFFYNTKTGHPIARRECEVWRAYWEFLVSYIFYSYFYLCLEPWAYDKIKGFNQSIFEIKKLFH